MNLTPSDRQRLPPAFLQPCAAAAAHPLPPSVPDIGVPGDDEALVWLYGGSAPSDVLQSGDLPLSCGRFSRQPLTRLEA